MSPCKRCFCVGDSDPSSSSSSSCARRALSKIADVVKLAAFLVCTVAFGWKVLLQHIVYPNIPRKKMTKTSIPNETTTGSGQLPHVRRPAHRDQRRRRGHRRGRRPPGLRHLQARETSKVISSLTLLLKKTRKFTATYYTHPSPRS